MAGSGVAACPAQDGLDVPDESHFRGSNASDLDLQARGLSSGGHRDRRLSGLARDDVTIRLDFEGGRLWL